MTSDRRQTIPAPETLEDAMTLNSTIQYLEAEIMRLKNQIVTLLDQREEYRAEAEGEIERLRLKYVDIQQWVRHADNCLAGDSLDWPCVCGLDELLQEQSDE